jgi:type III secretory pathway component EscS
MTLLYDAIAQLQFLGVADVLLPFLLVFAISFAMLQKTQVLHSTTAGEPRNRKLDAVVALVLGMMFVFPHIVWGTPDPFNPYLINGFVDPVKVINNSLPQISVVIIAVLMGMLLLGMFGRKTAGSGQVNTFIVTLTLVVVVYVFGTSAGWFGNGLFPRWLWFLQDSGTVSLLIVILVFGLIVYFITRDEDNNNGDKGLKLGTWVDNL